MPLSNTELLVFEWTFFESVCKSYGTFGETQIWAQYPIRIWLVEPNHISTQNPKIIILLFLLLF